MLNLYQVKPAKNAPGFASDWYFQNIDLPDFQILLATKIEQHSHLSCLSSTGKVQAAWGRLEVIKYKEGLMLQFVIQLREYTTIYLGHSGDFEF